VGRLGGEGGTVTWDTARYRAMDTMYWKKGNSAASAVDHLCLREGGRERESVCACASTEEGQ